MEKVTQRQQLCESAEDATAIVAIQSEAEEEVAATLSLISLQSLLTLLRSPNSKQKGHQQQTWLSEVAAQYVAPDSKLLVAYVSHTRGRLGTNKSRILSYSLT